jgi:hypothetical protein
MSDDWAKVDQLALQRAMLLAFLRAGPETRWQRWTRRVRAMLGF